MRDEPAKDGKGRAEPRSSLGGERTAEAQPRDAHQVGDRVLGGPRREPMQDAREDSDEVVQVGGAGRRRRMVAR